MSDWFFQECVESDQEALMLSAIRSGEITIENRDCIDRTPLMVAIEFGKLVLVQSLLNLGANPNSKSHDGETCLSRSIDVPSIEIAEALLNAGADIEQIGSNFLTPLALASVRGNASMIKYLLHRGANIEARGEMDETPLIEASFFGHQAAVICLLQHGADRTATDVFGRNAQMVAKERGNSNVVDALASLR